MSTRKMKIMLVTPEVATRWLNECNTHNRPLRDSVVSRYASAMKRGEWKLTTEPVAFCGPYTDECSRSLGQTLINGQHRLYAVVESGIPCEMTVWWGCEPDEFQVIDQGAVRTLGDVLATTRRDLSDSTLVASVCSSVAAFGLGVSSYSGGKMGTAQIQEILHALEPEIVAVVDYKKRLRKTAPRPLMSALVLTQIINPGMTARIADQLKDAVGFTERDPMRALHLYLSDSFTSTARDTRDVMNYKICHAMAARLRGDQLRVLRVTGEGIGWLRDAAKSRIDGLVAMLHGGKVPQHFYQPKLVMEAAT